MICDCGNRNNTIHVIKGTTNIIEADFNYADFANLEKGKAALGVKRKPKDAEYVLFKEVEYNLSEDYITFTIEPNDTISLPVGTYFYDIGILKDTDFYIIIPKAEFVIEQVILSREDVT